MNQPKIIALICFICSLVPSTCKAQGQLLDKMLTELLNKCKKDLLSDNAEDRRRAVDGFCAASENISHIVTALQAALRDRDDEIRLKAAKGLAAVGASARSARGDLVRVLESDKVPQVRIAAANALGAIFFESRLGHDDQQAVVALTKSMRHDQDTLVRRAACYAVGNIGAAAETAAPELMHVINEQNDQPLREIAANSLVRVVGANSKQIVPALVAGHKHGTEVNREVEKLTLLALGRIKGAEDTAIPVLVQALKNQKRPDLRWYAASALGEMGPRAHSAIPALVDSLQIRGNDKESVNAVRAAISALANMGSAARIAVPALQKLAESSSYDNGSRQHAKQLIHKLTMND